MQNGAKGYIQLKSPKLATRVVDFDFTVLGLVVNKAEAPSNFI